MDDHDQAEMQTCPLCAEPVKPTAVVCPHCKGQLRNTPLVDTYRNRPGRQIAGVAVALAEALGISVTFVRLGFIILTFVNFLGPVIYVTLWLLIPEEPGRAPLIGKVISAIPGEDGDRSIFERLMEELKSLYGKMRDTFRSRQKKTPEPPNGEAPEPTS
jgi:phage shock protein PspC (stress-responsive transcriptional regulator)